ncbi:MAG TPA: hypothetical protein VFG62_02205 [Rhodopila sp.]|nr:hypothetical protein [Rhodopila sp.]
MQQVQQAVTALRLRRQAVATRLAAETAQPPARGFPTVDKAINAQRGLVEQEQNKALSEAACGEAERLMDALEKMVREAAEELADLGGDAPAVITAFGGAENAMQLADAAFGDRTKLRAAVKAFKTPQALANLSTVLGNGNLAQGATTLTALQTAFKPNEIEAIVKDLGGDRVAALLAASGSPGALAKAVDALGVAGLDALAPKSGDAAAPFAVIAELGGPDAAKAVCAETGLGGKPKALAAMLTKGCGGDAKKLATMLAAFPGGGERAQLKSVIERGGMGDAPDCLGELMADGCDGRPAALKDLVAKLSQSDAGLDGLKRLLTTGGMAGKKGGNDAVVIDPKCLSKLLKFGAGDTKQNDPNDDGKRSQALCALCAKMGDEDCARLSRMLTDGGMGTEPDVLGHMAGLGCDGDPDTVTGLVQTLDDPATQAKLKALLKKGGFGQTDDNGAKVDIDPKCLATLLKTGCKGKDADLKALIDNLDGTDCANLAKTMTTGGLGKAPDALGGLFAEGCNGRAAAFKAFATSFGASEDRQKGLERLLTKAGLKGQNAPDGTVQIDPKCLAGLLKFSAGDTDLNDPTQDATRSDTLADICKDLDVTACTHLSKVLVDGGMGTEPNVLGHIAGIGCDSDPAKIATLGEKLDDATTLARLKDVLQTGNFGEKNAAKAATGTKPECLAQMLQIGCEGNAQELKSLIDALDNDHCKKLGKVMKEGKMGERPQVLGNTYKLGCLEDPYNPASGKQPNHLKTLVTAFGTGGDEAKLKDLLENTSLGDETNHPEWLGKVIRDGFTERNYGNPPPPPASGKAQQPAMLKDLHTAFNGSMGKLNNMVNAMGTMPPRCGVNDEPGKALQNVLNINGARGGVPIASLQNQFYDTLNVRAAGAGGGAMGAGGPPGGGNAAPSLSGMQLIQEAASIEREDVAAPMATIGGYDTDMDHVMCRHNRTAPRRDVNGNNNTSMLPKNITEVTVRAIIAGCIADSSGPKTTAPVPPNNPPILLTDLKANQMRQYKPVSGAGYTGVIGYKWDGANVTVGQFYPTGGPDCVSINAQDLRAIQTSLRPWT